MGNALCNSSDTSGIHINQPATCYVSNSSNDAIVYYENLIDAYDFASTVITTHIGVKRGEIKSIKSFDEICDILTLDPNTFINIDSNVIGSTYIYLGNYTHSSLEFIQPELYTEKNLIKHYNRVKLARANYL